MNSKLVSIIALLSLLSGCASYYPLPVEEPSALEEKSDGTLVRRTPDYKRGGLMPAVDIDEAIENLKIYGDAYQKYSDKLRRNEYISNDLTFAGGVLGVIGGVSKSIETALTGVALSSGATITSQRYQFLVQATNYENASVAMYCMYTKLFPVRGEGVEYNFVNERIDEVRRKLRKAQSSIQLITPDLSKLKASLLEVIENPRRNGGEKAAGKPDLKMMAELKACVAAF
ncbi:hypothetical protein [Pseudoalteromonas xiamenensis]|uniref:Lipoprotein n=1 Tax=Pseudoalteromonas xiamenensis TaxID=882626 RepID=A0A975DJN0_9GAMM|nr:hypothetical protein [Pseudoalteromonas xiamenensis]QTH72962.1 hypothetical protein J5O05_17535 [Pseudoalteromonas xiamenensis]